MTPAKTKLERAKKHSDQSRAAFEESMREAHANGMSTRAIAAVVGLSHQRVWQILRGE